MFWEPRITQLPCAEHFDILLQPLQFLQALTTAIEQRHNNPKVKHDVLAKDVVKKLFHGLGAYTVCEVFHRGGMLFILMCIVLSSLDVHCNNRSSAGPHCR